MEEKEQGNLIGSDKVEGTAVYGANSEKIGSIERVMIDKMSGKFLTPYWRLVAFSASDTITIQFLGLR